MRSRASLFTGSLSIEEGSERRLRWNCMKSVNVWCLLFTATRYPSPRRCVLWSPCRLARPCCSHPRNTPLSWGGLAPVRGTCDLAGLFASWWAFKVLWLFLLLSAAQMGGQPLGWLPVRRRSPGTKLVPRPARCRGSASALRCLSRAAIYSSEY